MAVPETILVVDDDRDVREMVRSALEGAGYRVIDSDRVAEGLRLFLTQRPDLVILDLELPDGDGMECCDRMRRSERGATPIIMLTGRGAVDDKLKGLAMGADQYLVKPIHPRELLSWVLALLRRRDYEREKGR